MSARAIARVMRAIVTAFVVGTGIGWALLFLGAPACVANIAAASSAFVVSSLLIQKAVAP